MLNSAQTRGPRHSCASCRPARTVSLDLTRFERQHWLTDDATMDIIAEALDHIRKLPLLTPRMAARLQPVDPLALKAGLLGSNPDGLFKL